MFDPDALSPTRLNELRAAAESAWGDDTRHEGYVGHPQPSAGNCFVTAQWLKNKLGGHIGVKNGHYFWVSPDRHYALDLTGELVAYPPADPTMHEPGELDPHHLTWRPGPVIYQRADSPIFKGFRVIDDHSGHPRAKAFAHKADLALDGKRVAAVHVADFFGPSGFQGPQQQEDMDLASRPFPMLHDEPAFDPASMSTHEYQWAFANGQLHVSPHHTHEDLISHAGAHPDSHGPVALGKVHVSQNHAVWTVASNISLRGLHELLKDYSDTVGWDFDGMIGADGKQIHEDFGPKSSMWFTSREDGHLLLSKRPLPKGRRIEIVGKTARVPKVDEITLDNLREWASDMGYKLAEYPGGGNMLDQMKNREHYDLFNRGDPDFRPEPVNEDQDLGSNLTCGHCGAKFDRLEALRLHERDHEPQDAREIEDGHFPQIDDFDAPLPFRRRQPSPNQGETIY